MALVAGVGAACLYAHADVRVGDLMATDPLQEPIGRVGHVAVVAEAAGRIGPMMRMLLQSIAEVGMTLQARVVAFHAAGQLVVRVAVVHRMAGETGHVAIQMARVAHDGGGFPDL